MSLPRSEKRFIKNLFLEVKLRRDYAEDNGSRLNQGSRGSGKTRENSCKRPPGAQGKKSYSAQWNVMEGTWEQIPRLGDTQAWMALQSLRYHADMVHQIYEGLLALIKSLPTACVNNVCLLGCVYFLPLLWDKLVGLLFFNPFIVPTCTLHL